MIRVLMVAGLLTCFAWTQQSPGVPASVPAPGSPAELVKQGDKLNSEGKQDEALALYSKALEQSPNLYEAHLDAGVALDLKGEYKRRGNISPKLLKSRRPTLSRRRSAPWPCLMLSKGTRKRLRSLSSKSSLRVSPIATLPARQESPMNSLAFISNPVISRMLTSGTKRATKQRFRSRA